MREAPAARARLASPSLTTHKLAYTNKLRQEKKGTLIKTEQRLWRHHYSRGQSVPWRLGGRQIMARLGHLRGFLCSWGRSRLFLMRMPRKGHQNSLKNSIRELKSDTLLASWRQSAPAAHSWTGELMMMMLRLLRYHSEDRRTAVANGRLARGSCIICVLMSQASAFISNDIISKKRSHTEEGGANTNRRRKTLDRGTSVTRRRRCHRVQPGAESSLATPSRVGVCFDEVVYSAMRSWKRTGQNDFGQFK